MIKVNQVNYLQLIKKFNKIYNIFFDYNMLPTEILDLIFDYIYEKGCIILENGTILDYKNYYYYQNLIFVIFPKKEQLLLHFFSNKFNSSPFKNIQNFIIYDNVLSINNKLFKNCYCLKEIYLNNNIIDIKDEVFMNCLNL